MTYNWNNMVSITVPTGTNGWLYSGELTINGVKARFPVGVPTSVPEPAAVLLKKMIELEQKEDANTAKPQNHYVGDVTIPAGKTLTLEKGAKFVDNSGPSEVVILPETELEVLDITSEGGAYALSTPFETAPSVGAIYKLLWGGGEYTGASADLSALFGYTAIVIGNLTLLGELEGVVNPDPSAPFAIVMYPYGLDERGDGKLTYGMMMSTSVTPEPPVLSIVQIGGAASGGESAGSGVMTARVAASSTLKDMALSGCDKKFAEFMAAYKAGKLIRIIATTEDNGNPVEYVGNVVYYAVMGGTDTFAVAMPYATGTTTKQFLLQAGDGGAAIFTSYDN